MRRLVPLLIAPLMIVATAACTPTPHEAQQIAADKATDRHKLNAALAGLTPGEPTSCISQFPTQQMKSYGSTIVYTVSSTLKYRSETGGGCEGIGRGDILITKTTGSQLCQGDIAQTVDSAARFPTGSCSFGAFVPYRKP